MKTKFKGALAKRIKPRSIGLLASKDDVNRQIAEHIGEDDEKLLLLCDHYGIKRGDFYSLSLSLARDFVEGFKEEKSPGRKVKWTNLNKGALVVEIERLTKRRTVAWATKQLANREPWKSFLEKKDDPSLSSDPAEALRHVYYGYKDNKWAAIMRNAYSYHKYENSLNSWDLLLNDFVRKPHPE